MICSRFDVAVVPFPFTDMPAAKRRPALVLTREEFNRHGYSIMAMITTKRRSPWPGDTSIESYQRAGLKVPCIVRLKLFTLDNRLIRKILGSLSKTDADAVESHLQVFLGNS
ncbi:MAG: type II toxin-antitoxin system PemK/MazF family toxin [Desulfobacterales bacterium]|nr:type II toxin-antitoxin system PemK/MazF family toxin [Desulfobacterales bacterium]MCF8080439.1 type II toxin-antitoxin system PemK/MazF family toxin [Desulfobacterales bacterium]